MDTQELQHALASKHATVSYLALAVIALLIVLMSAGGYVALKIFDARLAAAEKQEQVFVQTMNDYRQQLALDTQQRAELQSRIDNLASEIVRRDQQTQRKIDDVNTITTPKEATEALNIAYGFTFDPTSVPQLKLLTITKLEHDTLQADVKQFKEVVSNNGQQIASLNTDLTKANDALGE